MVVVDEAQDFTEGDWELAKALAAGGPCWAFGDAGQSFWPERVLPRGLFGAQWNLKARYRCPEPLASFAARYRPDRPGPDRAGGDAAAAAREALKRFPELRVVRVDDRESTLDRANLEVVVLSAIVPDPAIARSSPSAGSRRAFSFSSGGSET